MTNRTPSEEARLLRKHSHDIHGKGVEIRNEILSKYGVKLDELFTLADALSCDMSAKSPRQYPETDWCPND